MEPCPCCNIELDEGFEFCPYCGEAIAAAADEEQVCPRCGEPLGEELDEGECSRCGAYIVRHRQTGEPVIVRRRSRSEATSATTEQRRQSIFWPVVGALLFVFIVVPIIIFVGCGGCVAAAGAAGAVGSDFVWIVIGCAIAAGIILWLVDRFRSR